MYICRKFGLKYINIVWLGTKCSINLSGFSNRTVPFSTNKVFHYVKDSSRIYTPAVSATDNIDNFNKLVKFVSDSRRIDMQQISQILDNIKEGSDSLTEDNALFLIEGCRKIIPGESFLTKHEICQRIFDEFVLNKKFSNDVYHTFISVCTENRHSLNVEALISSIGDNINYDILKQLLRNVCERGNTEKALKVLEVLKNRGFAADEEVFNNLILCHALKGGLVLGQTVLQAMSRAKLSMTNETKLALIRGLSQRDEEKDFIDTLDNFPLQFNESILLVLLDTIGFAENHSWIKHIKKKLGTVTFSRDFLTKLEKLCMSLIHNKKYDSAMEIYKSFIDPSVDIKYGSSILREMLICSSPIEKIVEFAEKLKESGLNEYALEDVTNLSMKYKLTTSAMSLLKYFNVLRPHYFWPILLKAHSSSGETGIMEVVQNANEINVKFDNDSFQHYIYPNLDFTNPERIIQNFQKYGYTVKMLLTPMVVLLLKMKETKFALEICNRYNVQIGNEDLMDTLPHTWISTMDHVTCLSLIQKMSESTKKILLGDFLTGVIYILRSPSRLRPLLQLLMDANERGLTIDSATADNIINVIRNNFSSSEILHKLEAAINDLLDVSSIASSPNILHPGNMSTEQLECHLIELKAKHMQTRGVIRKLIQKHTNEGNTERVKELQEELIQQQYRMSPGMLSSLMYTNIQEENLLEAKNIYSQLKKSSVFKIDVFKVIDLAALMVKNKKFNEAYDLLMKEAEHRNIQPSKNVERNCKELLSSIKDLKKQSKMFEMLMEKGYCGPYNVLLGCLIQLRLEQDDLNSAVDMFVDFAQKYRTTPMQIVLMCKTLEYGSQELLQKVLDATAYVYGSFIAHSALISALCEVGYKKQLIVLLQNPQFNCLKEIEKRCDRWVVLNNLKPLETLLDVSREVSPKLLNRSKIQLSIMQIYNRKNDCEGAVEFWKQLVDNEEFITPEVDMEFNNLLDRCKYTVPDDLHIKYRVK